MSIPNQSILHLQHIVAEPYRQIQDVWMPKLLFDHHARWSFGLVIILAPVKFGNSLSLLAAMYTSVESRCSHALQQQCDDAMLHTRICCIERNDLGSALFCDNVVSLLSTRHTSRCPSTRYLELIPPHTISSSRYCRSRGE